MPFLKCGPGSKSVKPRDKARGAMAEDALFEIVIMGASARVTAIDPKSGQEATIIAPANLDQRSLQLKALAKLRYVLKRQAEKPSPG